MVAVDALGNFQDTCDAVSALFGSEVVRFAVGGTAEPELTRAPDGVLHDGIRPRRTGLSAVLYFDRLLAWTLGQAKALLITNPWARLPYAAESIPLTRIEVVNGLLEHRDGASLKSVFGLSPGWPESSGA